MGPHSRPDDLVETAQLAESAGIESLWTGEHVVLPSPQLPAGQPVPPDHPYLDSLLALSWAAAHTTNLLLGTGIVVLPHHNPVVFAKQAATLDVLSHGRLRLGVGAGYQEREFAAVGRASRRPWAAHRRIPRRARAALVSTRTRVSRSLRRLRRYRRAPSARAATDPHHRRRPRQGVAAARCHPGPRLVRVHDDAREHRPLPRLAAVRRHPRRTPRRTGAARDHRHPFRTAHSRFGARVRRSRGRSHRAVAHRLGSIPRRCRAPE